MFSTLKRLAAWLVALAAVAAVAALALIREQHVAVADRAVVETLAVQRSIADTMSSLKDAETGQRGFLLTGDDGFLAPYAKAREAIPQQLATLKTAVRSNEEQSRRARAVEQLAQEKLAELAETIAQFKTGHAQESLGTVREGRGRRLMVAMRAEANRMLAQETDSLAERTMAAAAERQRLLYLLYASSLLFLALAVGGVWSASRGVVEAKRANARLQQSEQALRSLADNASDLVRVLGSKGELVYVSPSCTSIIGFSQSEMLAMPARALLPETEREEARRLVAAAQAGGVTDEPFIHRLTCKDGSFRWFETKYRLALNAPEGSGRVHLTSRDITARKLAEDALRRQTRHLESILSSIGDGVVVADESRTLLLVNPVAAQYIRQGPGDSITSDWVQQHEARELDGTTPFSPERGPLTQALNGENVDDLGLILHDREGHPRAFSVTARPIRDGAAFAGCVAVYRDITEQRRAKQELEESEQRQRVLSEASFEGIAITSEGFLLDTNSTFAAWFGHTPESIVGQADLPLFAPEDRELARANSAVSGVFYEARMVRADGSLFPVEVHGRDATLRGSKVRIAVIRDATEKKRQEAELLQQAELLRALSLKDELTGLRNRRGFVELGKQQLRAVARAKRSACVFFVDLNGMKAVNDTLGHEAGDRALVATARILLSVFRDSDIVSRLGGDEFAVFATECAASDVPSVRQRLGDQVAHFNAEGAAPFSLSLSVGVAIFEPGDQAELEALIEAADQDMYYEKRAAREAAKRPAEVESLPAPAASVNGGRVSRSRNGV